MRSRAHARRALAARPLVARAASRATSASGYAACSATPSSARRTTARCSAPDADDAELADLPTLPKPLLMEQFDRVVTDPRLRLDDLRAFLAEADAGALVPRRVPRLLDLGHVRRPRAVRLLAGRSSRTGSPCSCARSRGSAWPPRHALVASAPRARSTSRTALRGDAGRAQRRAARLCDDAARRDGRGAERVPARGLIAATRA